MSRMTSQTPMKKIWQMIRRISGKADPAAISHLKVNSSTIEQPGEIADNLHPPLPILAHQSTTPTAFNDSKLEKRRNKLSSPQIGV